MKFNINTAIGFIYSCGMCSWEGQYGELKENYHLTNYKKDFCYLTCPTCGASADGLSLVRYQCVEKQLEATMEALSNSPHKDLPIVVAKYPWDNDEEWEEHLKNSDTLIGASMRFREAVVELIGVMGIERFAFYCIKKLDKFITNVSNRYKTLTKH